MYRLHPKLLDARPNHPRVTPIPLHITHLAALPLSVLAADGSLQHIPHTTMDSNTGLHNRPRSYMNVGLHGRPRSSMPRAPFALLQSHENALLMCYLCSTCSIWRRRRLTTNSTIIINGACFHLAALPLITYTGNL